MDSLPNLPCQISFPGNLELEFGENRWPPELRTWNWELERHLPLLAKEAEKAGL